MIWMSNGMELTKNEFKPINNGELERIKEELYSEESYKYVGRLQVRDKRVHEDIHTYDKMIKYKFLNRIGRLLAYDSYNYTNNYAIAFQIVLSALGINNENIFLTRFFNKKEFLELALKEIECLSKSTFFDEYMGKRHEDLDYFMRNVFDYIELSKVCGYNISALTNMNDTSQTIGEGEDRRGLLELLPSAVDNQNIWGVIARVKGR